MPKEEEEPKYCATPVSRHFMNFLKFFSELHFRLSLNSLLSDLHLRNLRVHWKNLFGGIQLRVCKCLLVGNSLCFCLCVFFGSYVLANVYWSAIFYTQYPGRTCAHHCMEAKFWVKSNKKNTINGSQCFKIS